MRVGGRSRGVSNAGGGGWLGAGRDVWVCGCGSSAFKKEKQTQPLKIGTKKKTRERRSKLFFVRFSLPVHFCFLFPSSLPPSPRAAAPLPPFQIRARLGR